MRRAFCVFAASCLFLIPAGVFAEGLTDASIVAEWHFESEDDIAAWEYTNIEEVELLKDAIRFPIAEEAVLYRELPSGFHQSIDGVRFSVEGVGLTEVTLLFLETNEQGVTSRLRITFSPDEGPVYYVPLEFYRRDLQGMNMLAISLDGSSSAVTVGPVLFASFSFSQKIGALWSRFWDVEPFLPHTINLITGPVLTTDAGPLEEFGGWRQMALSLNAVLLVLLSIVGFGLLLFGCWLRSVQGWNWERTRRFLTISFLSALAAVWLLYDARMGIGFLQNILRDQSQYIAAPYNERMFRDIGRFTDFSTFVREHLPVDTKRYVLALYEQWPYAGMMQYATYPALPDTEELSSDIWVIYDRNDMGIDAEGRLLQGGIPFSEPGVMLGQFDAHSFLFRGTPLL